MMIAQAWLKMRFTQMVEVDQIFALRGMLHAWLDYQDHFRGSSHFDNSM